MCGTPKTISFPCCKLAAKCLKEKPVQNRSSQKVASEGILPKTGCIFQNWQLSSSGKRFQHRKPIIPSSAPNRSTFLLLLCFEFFWGGTVNVLSISLLPSGFYSTSSVLTWDCAAEFLLSCALTKLNQQPRDSETIPGLLASMWQPDCHLSWWFICTGLQDPGREVPWWRQGRGLFL